RANDQGPPRLPQKATVPPTSTSDAVTSQPSHQHNSQVSQPSQRLTPLTHAISPLDPIRPILSLHQLYLPSKEVLKQKLDEWSAAASR
ncbi:MAG: hypothetical protein ACOYOF_17435, partial [Verrucomicrobiaceae bacterium]